MKRVIPALMTSAVLTVSVACSYRAAPEPNASKSEEQAQRVNTPSGGGAETTDRQSVRQRPATADNTQQGSAVPPAPADQTRPHPQQQNRPAQVAQQNSSSSPR